MWVLCRMRLHSRAEYRAQDYIPGPISTADWARFQHYARYVHVLCYPGTNTIDPLVFTYLTQRAGGAPIFPNLREIIWLHATPELAIMTSPSLRVLRIPEAGTEELNGCRLHEYGFRARRHALKTLTPVILGGVPGLEVLELRLMGHESFWEPLGAAFGNRLQPLCRQLHTAHITESPRVLTRAALDALSRVEKLAELRIDVVGKNYLVLAEWNIPHITRTFASLKRLRLRGLIPAVAALVCAIDAPGLEDVELETWELHPHDWEELAHPPVEALGAAFSVAFDSLRRRNAATVRRLSVIVQDSDAPLFLFPATSDPSSSLPAAAQPLLELRCLQDLTLDRARDNRHISPQSVVRAWPSLRALSLPDFVLTPYALRSVARTCNKLERLSAKHLSADFLEQLPLVGLSSADGAPALRQLNVYDAMSSMSTADARKVASFLNSLFPQLEAETCSVLFDSTHKHPSVHTGGWPDVLREARMLQAVRSRD